MKNKRMWELRQAAESGTLDLYVYGAVEKQTFVDDGFLGSIVESENSANHFRQELARYPDVTQINLYINSKGGSVIEGTAIYNQLRRHPAHKTVYVDGFACSIASVIAMAGDEVVMPSNALMLVHNMALCVDGNAAELRKAAEDLDTINAAGRAAYLAKAGDKLTEERLTEMMDAETWLTAEECIQYGLADRLADQEADMSHAAEVLQKASLRLEQRIRFHQGLAAQLRAIVETGGRPKGAPTEEHGSQAGLAGGPMSPSAPTEKPGEGSGTHAQGDGPHGGAGPTEGNCPREDVKQSGSIKGLLGRK